MELQGSAKGKKKGNFSFHFNSELTLSLFNMPSNNNHNKVKEYKPHIFSH